MTRWSTRLAVCALALLVVAGFVGAAHTHEEGADARECRLCRQLDSPADEAGEPIGRVLEAVWAPPSAAAQATRLRDAAFEPVGRRGPPLDLG